MIFLTSEGNSDISAIPPALSVIGPKASKATTTPVIDSIEVAAIAILYSPAIESPDGANSKAPHMLAQTAITGMAVDFIDIPRPAIILVASPDNEASAISLTGLYSVLV